jgi:hypothetical protein
MCKVRTEQLSTAGDLPATAAGMKGYRAAGRTLHYKQPTYSSGKLQALRRGCTQCWGGCSYISCKRSYQAAALSKIALQPIVAARAMQLVEAQSRLYAIQCACVCVCYAAGSMYVPTCVWLCPAAVGLPHCPAGQQRRQHALPYKPASGASHPCCSAS